MKITLDHNCIINLANRTAVGRKVEAIVADAKYESFMVNIGDSEMREKGVRPDHYDKFEELLADAGIDHLSRLDPLMVWDVTFWDLGLWGDEETENKLAQIEAALFGNASPMIFLQRVKSHLSGVNGLIGSATFMQCGATSTTKMTYFSQQTKTL